MVYAYHQLPHSGIQSLAPYLPGKSSEAVVKEHGISDVIKLASNENPLGTSPDVLLALKNIKAHEIATYQTTSLHPFRKQLASTLDVDPDMIFLSNGSDTIFYYVLLCFALHSGKRLVTHEKAFIQYQIQANILNIPVHLTPLKKDMRVDIDALIEAATEETAAIFLANPNNPTGLLIEPSECIRLLSHVPENIIVVLDEAYFEYLSEDVRCNTASLLKKYPNLIVTRTFSKIYGLAALRLGYAITNPALAALLYRIQLPFIVNLAALKAGEAALFDHDFLVRSRENNTKGMAQIRMELKNFNIKSWPSHANFIMIETPYSAQQVDLSLQKQGVIVRPLTPYGLTQSLRVTIGTPQQNKRFLDALSHSLKELEHDTVSSKM